MGVSKIMALGLLMMMVMNCFCGMADQWKTFSLISSQDHCQRSSTSRISDMPQAGFEPAQNLSSSLVKWNCAVVITSTTQCHTTMLGHYTILYRINTSGVKNGLLFLKVEKVKSWYCKNNLWKQLVLLTIFTKCSIIDIWQGSKCASVSDFECTRILNMLGLQKLPNMTEYAWIISDYAWICQNMCECA